MNRWCSRCRFCFLPPPCLSCRRSSLAPSCFSVFHYSPLKHSFRLFTRLDTTTSIHFLMPRINQDSTNVPCPDFAGATYATVQQAISANGQITNEQATEQLMAAWNQTHVQDVETWNLQVQGDIAEQEELTRLAEEEEA